MIKLRIAIYDDIDLLYKWANDLSVRKNSFNTEQISYDDHVAWFNRIMNDSDVFQYILMDDNIPVGQIRLNVEDDEAEISYSIAPEYRGKGYGKLILQLVAEEASINLSGIKKLVAKVKPENIASNKLFEKEDYDLKYLCYSKNV